MCGGKGSRGMMSGVDVALLGCGCHRKYIVGGG